MKMRKVEIDGEIINVPESQILMIEGKPHILIRSENSMNITLFDGNRLKVSNIHKNKEGRQKATIKVVNKKGKTLCSNAFLLDHQIGRQAFINKCKECNVEITHEMLEGIGDLIEESLKPPSEVLEELGKYVPVKEYQDIAQQILKDNKPLLYIVNLDIGAHDEKLNVMLLYLICTSRLLDNPISVIVRGDSSTGKSNVVTRVVRCLFPFDTWHFITRGTARVLERLPDRIWDDKIIVFVELYGVAELDYALRALMTDHEYTLMYTVKDENGKYTQEMTTTHQKACFISTTVKDEFHDELDTRVSSIYARTSTEHKILVKKYMGRIRTSKIQADDTACAIQYALQQISDIEVLIPFMPLVSMYVPGVYRDLERFCTLIRASALLHHECRDRVMIDGQNYILANLADYYHVLMVYEEEAFLPEGAKDILNAIPYMKDIFTRKDLRDFLGWTESKVRRLMFYLEGKELEVMDGGQGKEYVYRVIEKNLDDLPPVHVLAQRFRDLLDTYEDGLPGLENKENRELLTALLRHYREPRACMVQMCASIYDAFSGEGIVIELDEEGNVIGAHAPPSPPT